MRKVTLAEQIARGEYVVDPHAVAEAMLRSAGFRVVEHPEAEVYVCRRAERPAGAVPVYPARGGGA